MNISSSFFKCLCVPTVIVTVIAVALFVFAAMPLRVKIASESDEIQKFKAKTENAERKISRLPDLRAQYATVEDDERKIPRLLSEAQTVDFIKEMEDVARDAGGKVSIAQGSVVDATKKPAPKAKGDESDGDASKKKVVEDKSIVGNLSWGKRLSLQITFDGEYGRAVNFLHKIETMSYRLDVLSVDIRPTTEKENVVAPVSAPAPLPVPVPTDGAALSPVPESPAPPVEPEKHPVAATFGLVVYLK